MAYGKELKERSVTMATKQELSIKEQMDLWEMQSWVPIGWVKVKMDIKSDRYLRSKVLMPNKDELQDFVIFPEKRGERWRFHRKLMQQWIDEVSQEREIS